MEGWRKDARHEPIIVDLEALVPKEHLLRKIEKVMDYEWLYERLDPYYCHDNGRPGTDPVVLIKMVLIQHLFGIPSLRQTYQRIQDTLSYRWFLGYGLLDNIPHFATVSYAFCKRFPDELTSEIFEHILNTCFMNFNIGKTCLRQKGSELLRRIDCHAFTAFCPEFSLFWIGHFRGNHDFAALFQYAANLFQSAHGIRPEIYGFKGHRPVECIIPIRQTHGIAA